MSNECTIARRAKYDSSSVAQYVGTQVSFENLEYIHRRLCDMRRQAKHSLTCHRRRRCSLGSTHSCTTEEQERSDSCILMWSQQLCKSIMTILHPARITPFVYVIKSGHTSVWRLDTRSQMQFTQSSGRFTCLICPPPSFHHSGFCPVTRTLDFGHRA